MGDSQIMLCFIGEFKPLFCNVKGTGEASESFVQGVCHD